MEDEIYFVQLQNSKDFRKNLLESIRQIIQILQSYENIKRIRFEKAQQMQKLVVILAEINSISSQLKISIPPVKVDRIAEEKTKKPVQPTAAARKKPMPAPANDGSEEARQLEAAIGQIEAKLKKLG
jgi:hypothetical protein